MFALYGLLTIIIISIIFVRIGAAALELTGLSADVSAFQAQSAFYGAGFTTSESEAIVSHAVRRRIIGLLIISGSVGLTSSAATLIIAFVGQPENATLTRILVLGFGLLIIALLTRFKLLNRLLKRLVIRTLERSQSLKIHDYVQILGLNKGYTIAKLVIKPDSWMNQKSLKTLKLDREKILIISIYRMIDNAEKFLGVPNGDTVIQSGDVLMYYGREEQLIALANRCKGYNGDNEHETCMYEEERLKEIRKLKGEFE